MKAEIITIGDELLRGLRLNGNARYLARTLSDLGIEVSRITTVGDAPTAIEAAFVEARKRADLILSTGGLGPTEDDRTLATVAKLLGRRLLPDDALWQQIEDFFTLRGKKPTASNRSQALVPEGARILSNRLGTAPGLYLDDDGRGLVLLPGVPHEMRALVEEQLCPILAEDDRRETVVTARVRTTGIAESKLADLLSDFPEPDRLAYLPDPTGTELLIRLTGAKAKTLDARATKLADWIRRRVGDSAYGDGEETLVDHVAKLLQERGYTLTTAESCTAGLIAGRLTDLSGSSAYFHRGFVTYSNEAKTELLGVPEATLATHGAVSAETAAAMATGARERAGADMAVAVTGVAGPTGGSAEKPVGLVFLAVADDSGVFVQRRLFGQDRSRNRARTVQAALDLVRRRILGLPTLS